MNNRRDSRKNTKTDIKANRKSFFPVNMQLSHLLFGVDVFYLNSCLMLNYTGVLVKYNDDKYE